MKSLLKKQGHQQRGHRRERERGIAMLLLVSVMGTLALSLFFSYYFINNSVQQARQSHNVRVLEQAKAALLGYVVTGRADTLTADEFNFRQTLGRMPCPNTNGNGVAPGGCGTMATNVAMGLLPWSTLGLETLRDFEGACLWYSVAPRQKMLNVAVTAPPNPNDLPNLIPTVGLNPDSPASLTVVDANGAVLASDVVAVIVAPGAPQGTQNRPAAASACGINNADDYTVASQFLDQWSVTLDDNARAALPNSATARFVSVQMLPSSNRGAMNDHLIWITKAELNQAAMQAVARAMLNRLQTFNPQATVSAANFPPAAATPGGVCVAGLVSGFVPTSCPMLSGGVTWYLEPGYENAVGIPPRNGLILNQWPLFGHYAVGRSASGVDLQVDGIDKSALILIRGQIQRDRNQQPIQNCGNLTSATLTEFGQCIEGIFDTASAQYVNRQLLTSASSVRNYRTAAYGTPSTLASDAAIGIVNDDILVSR